MQFRPDSVLGVAGLLNAARAGNVVISNAVGNGVGDDKLVYAYVPTIIEYYLGEKPLLANVATYRCWLDDEREEVLDRVDELVVKPVEGSGGYGIVFGPDASEKELATISKKIRSDPRGWIAQQVVQLSTSRRRSTTSSAPRHVDLRPFVVNGGDDVGCSPAGSPGSRCPRARWSSTPARAAAPRTPGCWPRAPRWPTASSPPPGWCARCPRPPRAPKAENEPGGSSSQQQQQQSQVRGRRTARNRASSSNRSKR